MRRALILLVLMGFINTYAQEKKNYISVSGTSELSIPADQIDFSVQIRTVAESIEASKNSNDKAVSRLREILKETGINKDDIEQSPITLGKNYDYQDGKREQKGFFTNVNVTFKLKDFLKYYELSDKLASNDNFEVVSSYYTLSEYEKHHREAYIKAAIAAKEKAEYLAKALGVTVDGVLSVEEGDYARPMMMNKMEFADASGGAEVIAGNVKISRTIRVSFGLK